jgi:hypothetical protein
VAFAAADDTAATLVKRADDAMYAKKRALRERGAKA